MAVFFRDYFSQYPKRLMLRLREGDTVQLERFRDVLEARVVEVDCSLVKVWRLDICIGIEGLYICTCWPAYCMWMWYITLLFASACSCILKLEEVQLGKQFTNGCIEGVFAWHQCFWRKMEEWSVVPLIAVLLTSAAWLCSMLCILWFFTDRYWCPVYLHWWPVWPRVSSSHYPSRQHWHLPLVPDSSRGACPSCEWSCQNVITMWDAAQLICAAS